MKVVTIGKYLLDRLSEVGIKDIFGVPGDYNLEFLDGIIDHQELNWIGCTNELNAAYSADGYARINGIGAILTTYGVGELSAVNGIAGSYSEDVPVIHIVGTPKREYFKRHMILHHSLGTDDTFGSFKKIYENISSYTVWLDAKNAINQIDSAIKAAVFYKKPVYIMLPVDVASFEILCDIKPLSFASGFDVKEHAEILEDIEKKLKKSNQAVIISGHKIVRYGLSKDLEQFATNTNINVVTTAYGKGSFNEENELYLGIYNGEKSLDQSIVKFVDTADLILIIGNKFTDITSSNFKLNFDKNCVVEISDTHVKYDTKLFTNHSFGFLIKKLASKKLIYDGLSIVGKKDKKEFEPSEAPIKYNALTNALNEFIKPSDILVSDIGTCMYMTQYLKLKKGMKFILQPLWASIGFSFPASFGAKIATGYNRVINVIGDGAFNMTFNEIGSVISKKVNMITILINNKGYTIEKYIHGPKQSYNNIPSVNYTDLVKAFDPNGLNSLTFKVNSELELSEALKACKENNDKFIFIEVMIPEFDIHEYGKKIFNLE
ncbi:MAG: hypothetical protein K2I76_03605 [Malacoplasma sp.]|nr:hypothetical protein [Malacoplasma sp.]MDE6428881.1 hypothetical protein [Malacoplasma sp.]